MSANHESHAIDPTFVRSPAERALDFDCQATVIDPKCGLPPGVRELIEREMKIADDQTRIGELVGEDERAVLMTAHLPSELGLEDMLDEDLAAEAGTPWDGEPGADEPIVGPPNAFPEPHTVHNYQEMDLPAPKRACDTRNIRVRAKTPTGGRESDEFLVRPVSMARPASEPAEDLLDDLGDFPADPYDVSAIAGVFEPLAYGADDDETKTFLKAIDAVPGHTAIGESISSDRARFTTPAPRPRATARGVGPQRYIATTVGQNPLPKVGQATPVEVPGQVKMPSRFLVATLGLACFALMMVQVL